MIARGSVGDVLDQFDQTQTHAESVFSITSFLLEFNTELSTRISCINFVTELALGVTFAYADACFDLVRANIEFESSFNFSGVGLRVSRRSRSFRGRTLILNWDLLVIPLSRSHSGVHPICAETNHLPLQRW